MGFGQLPCTAGDVDGLILTWGCIESIYVWPYLTVLGFPSHCVELVLLCITAFFLFLRLPAHVVTMHNAKMTIDQAYYNQIHLVTKQIAAEEDGTLTGNPENEE